MKTVPLHGEKAAGRVALVDDGDYDLVMQYRWRVWEYRGKGPYALTRKGLSMHRLIMGRAGIDHRNGNGLDNQRSNLRPATVAQNNQNRRRRPGTSQYKDVSWHKGRSKWTAHIQFGKSRYLGLFRSEEDAARAYDAAAFAAWGEYAYLNFPESADADSPR